MRAPLQRLLALPAVLATSALLSACGGSSPDQNVAAKEQAQEQKAETKFADFAKCLREHGVNAEAVSRPGGGHGLKVSPGKAGPAATEATQKDCARYRPEPQEVSVSPQQKIEQEEVARKWGKCMREHGVEVEVEVHGNASRARLVSPTKGAPPSNPESPAFQKAAGVCGGPKGP
jgi:hypothetical protein